MQKNRDVIEHYLEEQGQFVTPRIEHLFLKKNQNAPRPSEHPPVMGEKC